MRRIGRGKAGEVGTPEKHYECRHCERSEAIRGSPHRLLDCFVASLLTMTVGGWIRQLRLITSPILAVLFALLSGHAATAHSASTAYLSITANGSDLAVQWSIAVRDLDDAVGIDADGDGTVTWGEAKAQFGAIDAYALSRLTLTADGSLCAPGQVEHLVDQLGDGAYIVLRFHAVCPRVPETIGVRYGLLFDLDPLHRGLLSLNAAGTIHAVALSPDRPDVAFDASPSLGATAASFFSAGVVHLLTGLDHMLFIAMLLVPALLAAGQDGAGRTQLLPRRVFVETVKVLSAFTAAHATTLTLSVLQIVHIPERLSETGIAITILVTAFDNIAHVLPRRRWPLAFAFGLIHGLGFANALGPLNLPGAALALALLSFNLGLEAVQIGIAAVILPLGVLVRSNRLLSRFAVPAASGAVAAVAAALIEDRAAGLGLMPF